MPHVAGAGRKWLNHRFASPIVSGGQQYEDHFNIADSFPFSYAWSHRSSDRPQDAILKRPETDPLVMHTQTATEYWVRRGSLAHTDTQGQRPAAARHRAGLLLVQFAALRRSAAEARRRAASARIISNIVATSMLFRAMLDAMDRWATDGTPPPPSRIPTRADGTLVGMRGVAAAVPRNSRRRDAASPNRLPLLDFGPMPNAASCGSRRHRCRPERSRAPGKQYTVLVPSVDRDGNDVPGVRAPMVAAPLGTYTGWNLARPRLRPRRIVASRAATSRSPRPHRSGKRSAIPARPFWSVTRARPPIQRPSARPSGPWPRPGCCWRRTSSAASPPPASGAGPAMRCCSTDTAAQVRFSEPNPA